MKSSKPTDLGMADEPTEHPPFLGRELSATNAELKKKRKLPYEVDNLELLWPKQICPDHFSSTAHEFLNFNNTKNDGTRGKEIAGGEIQDKLVQSEESDNNSNNSSRVDDNCLTLDVQAKEEKSVFLRNSQSAASDASGHAISNKVNKEGTPDSEETLQSEPTENATENGLGADLQSEPTENATGNGLGADYIDDPEIVISNKVNEEGTPDSEETLQSGPRENGTGNGLEADYIDDPEIAQYDMECCDGAQDDIILYSNDAAPFLFSSERRRLGQDSRTRSPKPTIDREFEQYFSMFMH